MSLLVSSTTFTSIRAICRGQDTVEVLDAIGGHAPHSFWKITFVNENQAHLMNQWQRLSYAAHILVDFNLLDTCVQIYNIQEVKVPHGIDPLLLNEFVRLYELYLSTLVRFHATEDKEIAYWPCDAIYSKLVRFACYDHPEFKCVLPLPDHSTITNEYNTERFRRENRVKLRDAD